MTHPNADIASAAGSARPTHRVAILVYDQVKLLDVAGPAEVFGEANRLGASYDVVLVSPDGADGGSAPGLRLSVGGAARAGSPSDTFLVSGGDASPTAAIEPELV